MKNYNKEVNDMIRESWGDYDDRLYIRPDIQPNDHKFTKDEFEKIDIVRQALSIACQMDCLLLCYDGINNSFTLVNNEGVSITVSDDAFILNNREKADSIQEILTYGYFDDFDVDMYGREGIIEHLESLPANPIITINKSEFSPEYQQAISEIAKTYPSQTNDGPTIVNNANEILTIMDDHGANRIPTAMVSDALGIISSWDDDITKSQVMEIRDFAIRMGEIGYDKYIQYEPSIAGYGNGKWGYAKTSDNECSPNCDFIYETFAWNKSRLHATIDGNRYNAKTYDELKEKLFGLDLANAIDTLDNSKLKQNGLGG